MRHGQSKIKIDTEQIVKMSKVQKVDFSKSPGSLQKESGSSSQGLKMISGVILPAPGTQPLSASPLQETTEDSLGFLSSESSWQSSKETALSPSVTPVHNGRSTTPDPMEVQQTLLRIRQQAHHDIQSPVGALKNAIALLDVNREGATKLIHKSLERIQGIVSDLTSPTHPGLEKPLDSAIVDINAMVKTLVEEKQWEYQQKSVSFYFVPSKQDAFVNVDVCELSRALSNVINNAVEAVTTGEAHIIVAVSVANSQVMIDVVDNGDGVDPAQASEIFNYGYTYGKSQGTGTGLFQAADVMRRLGGEIALLPTPRGTCFRFSLNKDF